MQAGWIESQRGYIMHGGRPMLQNDSASAASSSADSSSAAADSPADISLFQRQYGRLADLQQALDVSGNCDFAHLYQKLFDHALENTLPQLQGMKASRVTLLVGMCKHAVPEAEHDDSLQARIAFCKTEHAAAQDTQAAHVRRGITCAV